MKKTLRGAKVVALLSAGALVIAACGSDSKDSGQATASSAAATTAAPATEAPATEAPATEAPATEAPATEAPAEVAMRVTYDINPDAVWDDGSPITAADFECTWQANLNTPGSIATVGYDQITSVAAGSSDQQVVVEFSAIYAPWKGLFNALNKQAAYADCNDVSADDQTMLGYSGRAYKLESWSSEGSTFVANENYWGDKPAVSKVVMKPFADTDTELAAVKAGEVDFSYPQFFGGIEEALADPNVKLAKVFGGDYEGLYFQQKTGPFADPIFRQAFALSVDREALFQQIYVPLGGEELLQCGPIVPGPYCPDDNFSKIKYDQAAADKLLTDAGWAKDGSGMWAKDGTAPEIRWMVNAGNTRRENTQAYLIPLLQAAGFNVKADNCEAACVFQQRLPALDYDLGMYISTAPPDPAYLTSSFACDQIPSEENGNQGQNNQGWCDEQATAELHEADATIDEAKRAELVKSAVTAMSNPENLLMLPLMQFPKSGAYRTDRIGDAATVEAEFNNYRAFSNFDKWQDLDGDGQIVIGAEQWPECLNAVTECANSSWYVWTVAFPLMPGAYDTTADGKYAVTNLLAGEAKVEVLG